MDLVFKLLKQEPEIQDASNAKDLVVKKGEVQFKDIDFSYQKERGILHNIDFNIPAGKTVAVVGFSGGGKSTLVRLLFRFYDVTKGKVLIETGKI